VHLPYPHHEDTDYFPNQVLVFWSDFRFSAANIQFWDHGDGVDYKAILEAIIKGATAALAGAGIPVFSWIPTLADAILDAMPSSWWRDSDTLLDTFYVLKKGQPYKARLGTGGAVQVDLAPWVLHPQ
jgi:hypothetical protein